MDETGRGVLERWPLVNVCRVPRSASRALNHRWGLARPISTSVISSLASSLPQNHSVPSSVRGPVSGPLSATHVKVRARKQL